MLDAVTHNDLHPNVYSVLSVMEANPLVWVIQGKKGPHDEDIIRMPHWRFPGHVAAHLDGRLALHVWLCMQSLTKVPT